MRKHDTILDVAGLLGDAEVLAESLLEGDLDEARFRANLISGQAGLLELMTVARQARAVTRLLDGPGERLLPGHAQAVSDLSLSLDQALAHALS